MRSRNFEVPEEIMAWFSAQLKEHELENEIEGATEDEEVIVRVEYESDKKKIINELQDAIDKYIEENEEEDDEDDNEDDENDENDN